MNQLKLGLKTSTDRSIHSKWPILVLSERADKNSQANSLEKSIFTGSDLFPRLTQKFCCHIIKVIINASLGHFETKTFFIQCLPYKSFHKIIFRRTRVADVATQNFEARKSAVDANRQRLDHHNQRF